MHFDENFQEIIGLGAVQRFTVFCCFLISFVEGFLSSGIWFLTSYLARENGVLGSQQSLLYLPFLIGHIFGHIILGGISDVTGRRSTLKGSCVTCYVASILAAVSPALVVYQISSVAFGFSLAGIQSGSRILLFETLPMNHRGAYIVIIDIIAHLGSLCALAWDNLLMDLNTELVFLKPWQLFFFVSAVLTVMGSCFVGVMPFSIRQMLCHQRIVSVNIMLRKYFALNKHQHESTYPINIFDQFVHIESRHYRREQCSDYFVFHFYCVGSYIWSTISGPFIIPTIFLSLFHICFFDGTPLFNTLFSERLRSSNKNCDSLFNNSTLTEFNQEENYYMFLSSLSAAILLFFVADRCPRNLLVAFCCSFASISVFALVHRFQYSLELPLILSFIFFHTSTSIILNILTLEMYPTKFRGTAHGLLKAISNFGILIIIISYQIFCSQLFTLFYYAVIAFVLGATAATNYPNTNRKPIVE